MYYKKVAVLLVLQSLLFLLMISCERQASLVVPYRPDTTVNNNDTIMTDTLMNIDSNTHNGNHTWLALGDSYTIGEAVNDDERFPAQTIDLLTHDSLFCSSPQYIATTGWTTQNLLNGIATRNPQGPFDIVSLLIGVNDQYQHLDTAGYRIRFTECLKKAIALAGYKKEHVFVLSIPDYGVTPFAQNNNPSQISKEIDVFNAINKDITASFKISYTDITPSTREAVKNPYLIAGDGLHPSGKEYAKWAALLAPKIKKVLQ